MENDTQEKEEDVVEPTDDSKSIAAPAKKKKKTWTSAEKVAVPDWMQSSMDAADEKRASDAAESAAAKGGDRTRAEQAALNKAEKAFSSLSDKGKSEKLNNVIRDPKFRKKHNKLIVAFTQQKALLQTVEAEVKAGKRHGSEKVDAHRKLNRSARAVERAAKDWLGIPRPKAFDPRIKDPLGLGMTKPGEAWGESIGKVKNTLLESKNKNMFNIVNETERDMAETLGYLNEFLPFSQEKMNYDRPVKIRFVSDQANAGDVLGKTAHYNPSIDEIAVYVDERHPKDIMRSISHELVHHSQNCRGEFDGTTTLGEQPYMQTSEHLNEMERQAYEVGNMTFRIWEDNYKHTQRENKKMSINEKTVRIAVKEALMKKIKEVVVREPGDDSPLTPEEIKLFLAASGHTGGLEVVPPGVSGADVEEELPPGVTAADVAEMAPEEEEVEVVSVDESTDKEWYRSALNESLIKRFIK
tara:strand:+ start:373 stop:1779 length:1407 start_codon:yes stop_codon:yes gene_type:complete